LAPLRPLINPGRRGEVASLPKLRDTRNRTRRACEKISTVALDAGFADVYYFNRAFRQFYGDTPSGVRMQAPQYG